MAGGRKADGRAAGGHMLAGAWGVAHGKGSAGVAGELVVLFVIFLVALALVSVLVPGLTATAAAAGAGTESGQSGQGRDYLWTMDTSDEVAGYSNDNTGAKFVLNNQIVRQGSSSVEVIPSGQAGEAKLALDLKGPELQAWLGNGELIANVYIPDANQLKPNMFFLGMADVTGDWTWVDGVFSSTQVKSGWNEVHYRLSPTMQKLDANRRYKLYFAFAHVKADKSKAPLTESFYLDGMWMEKGAAAQSGSATEAATADSGTAGETVSGAGQVAGAYLWTMDTQDELKGFDNDNTGAQFALEDRIVAQGDKSVAVIPSGSAPETKLALDLNGSRLERWIGKKEVSLNVYLPPENKLNPTMFFLGMADVTGDWTWVGGVFSQAERRPGWNEIHYTLADEMKDLNPSHKYRIYLAFAAVKEGGQKVPLTEKFFIDGIRMDTAQFTREDLLARVSEATKKEVADLLALDDDQLLEAVARKTFGYFWSEVNPANGLIKDRSTKDSPSSIAAVGFGLTAIPVAIERGWITKDEGYARTLTTLKTFADGGVEGKNGFFYHFVDMKNGRRYADSELSSIDTAIFIAGALFAGEYFRGTEVEKLANKLYENVDWQWMMNDGDTLAMGWKPEGGFLNARWNSFNESLFMYILAIGSPTRPIPASAWDNIYRPVNDNYISLPAETLFVYQYPEVWVDFRDKEDKYANYFNNAAVATRFNRLYSMLKRFNFKSYGTDVFGLSACDGPSGYKAYGASDGNHDGTIAPYASIGSLPFTPELSMASLRAMLEKHGLLIWGKYGFVSGFNVDQNWYSDQFVGIDEGDILAMIENYRSGLIWKYFMQNEAVQRGMAAVGFKPSSAEYAVTPGYMEQFEKMRLAPKDKKAVATRVEKPVTIDGDLSDWPEKPAGVITEEDNVPAGGLEKVDKRKQILNGRFYAKWDDQYLYLAADVADEYVVVNIAPQDKGAYYRTDSIEFYLDPGRAGSQAGLMKLAILPFDTEGNVEAVRHEDARPGPVAVTNPGIKVASKRTDKGYSIEVAIPLADLGIEAQPGVTLGFSQTIHNSNAKNAKVGEYVRTNMLAWNNLPEVWAHPEYWGELTLQ